MAVTKPATRTCYLHIGTPKAGSTTIQGFLHVYRDALQATGLDLPTFEQEDIFAGGVRISKSLEREKNPSVPKSQAWKWLDGHLAETDGDLCISREAFLAIFTEKKNITFVRRFFAERGVRLKMIAYVRDTAGFYNANYTQQAKRFLTELDFDGWAEKMMGSPLLIHRNARLFRNVLAQEEVEVVVRPLQNLGPKGLIGDFCEQIGRPDFDWSGFDEKPFRNETPGARTMAAALVVARKLREGVEAGKLADLGLYRELGRQFRELTATRGWAEKPFYGPTPEMAKRIEDRFAKSNERLAQRVWGSSWLENVRPSTKERCVYDIEAAPPAERAEIEDVTNEFIYGLIKNVDERRAVLNAPGIRKPGRISAEFP